MPLPFRSLASIAALSVAVAITLAPGSGRADPRLPDPIAIPAKLSLGDAMAIFRAHGLDLLLAEASVESARADLRAAGAVPNPVVSAGVGKSFGYNASAACESAGTTGCSSLQYLVGVSDSAAIFDSLWGKRGLRKRVAEAAIEAAKMSRVDAERTVGYQVKQAYITAALAKLQVEFAREVQASSKQTLDLMQVRYDKGAINEADLARIETAKLEADQGVDQALQNLRTAKIALAALLGARTLVPEFEIDAAVLKFAVPPGLDDASRESLVRAAYAHRPDLRGFVYQQQRAQAAIDLARRERYPDITLSLQYTQEGTGNAALAPPTLLGTVSMPIPIFYQNQGEIAKAEADLKSQTIQRAKVEAQVVSDVETAYANFVATETRVERMESRLLERSRRARDLVKLQYEKGAASLLELLDAQRQYIAVNVEYLQNLNDYWTAVIALEQAVGMEYLR